MMRSVVAMVAIFGVTALTASSSLAQQAQETDWFPGKTAPALPEPPSPNAFDDFMRASALVSGKDAIEKGADSLSLAQAKQIVSDNQSAFDAVHSGFARGYQPPIAHTGGKRTLYVGGDTSLGHLFEFAGDTCARDGDWAGATQYALDAIHFGRMIRNHGQLIDCLLGAVCESYGRKALWAAVDHLSASEARATVASLAAWDTDSPSSAADALQVGEWVTQGMYINEYHQAKATDIAEIRSEVGVADPHELYENYTSKMDAWIAVARVPFVKRQYPDSSDKLSQTLFPNFPNIFFELDDNRVEDELLSVSLALRSYYADHKAYPDSLGALTPRYIAAIPSDPFGHGEPLHYKSLKSAYRLYSVGPDETDDGGTAVLDPSVKGDTAEDREKALDVTLTSKGDIVAGVNL